MRRRGETEAERLAGPQRGCLFEANGDLREEDKQRKAGQADSFTAVGGPGGGGMKSYFQFIVDCLCCVAAFLPWPT